MMYRLHRNHYRAYMVGGAVRDLLLKRTPKDYDVVTDARPNKVKKLFRNSYLIGRRFRLVHVRFKDKVIEVSTFRKMPQVEDNATGDLLLRRENTFGTPEEDAIRRDFTINGLFYDIRDFSVIDYVGGLADVRKRMVRTIGDPSIRFREDPCRMIRAVRVAARIRFRIENDTWLAMGEYRNDLLRCAPARVLEEIYHLMKYGSAEASIRLLHRSKLMETLIPELAEFWNHPQDGNSPNTLLGRLDELQPGNPLRTPPLMLAVVFYPLINHQMQSLKPGDDLRARVEKCILPFTQRFHVPRRHLDRLTQIFIAQRWFQPDRKTRKRSKSLVNRSFFGESFVLANLRLNRDEPLWREQCNFWKDRILRSDISDSEKRNLADLMN